MLLVPTELTDDTEAYGFIFLESTERIDATRHTTDGTEMIACIAKGFIYTAINIKNIRHEYMLIF